MLELQGKRVTDKRLQRIDFAELYFLSLLDTSVTDKGIALLESATNLQEVSISSNVLTDACMETLCRLPALRSLLIHDAPLITDQGIAQLQIRENLRELYLDGTQLSDDGICSFTHLTLIRSLSLDRTLVTDEGVSQLAPLPNLKLLTLEETAVVGYGLCKLLTATDIYLDGCPIADDAVDEFATHLKGLRRLSLKDTPITDDCLDALSTLPQLESLRLTRTHITDKGITQFRGHPSLYTLEVCETYVSAAAVMCLEEQSPLKKMNIIR